MQLRKIGMYEFMKDNSMEYWLQQTDGQSPLKEKMEEDNHDANGFMKRFMCNNKHRDV